MQLKRDTDYALRIVLVIAEASQKKEKVQGLNLKTVCERTDIPRQIALRLCGRLCDVGFIQRRETAGEGVLYIPGPSLLEKTILDTIEVIEGQSNLFAIFDKKTDLYSRYGHALEQVSGALSKELSKISIRNILDLEKKHFAAHGISE